ncbi:hypothetical protein [Botryobacter ruber]|uniref:hypothetical protein n=1 Tax=Botryobacter ruber TaxID=2171629 RepID=UPI000F64AFDA|nr:hypothetical protein [Botryobacter ruber]
MKNILILGLALCMGVSLSSCDDDDEIRPMAITPTGTIDNDGDNDPGFEEDEFEDFIDEDEPVDVFEDGSDL